MPRLGLRLTPHGRLVVEDQNDALEVDAKTFARLTDGFALGPGYGLVRLGAGEVGQVLPPAFVWWRSFAARYVELLCLHAPGTEAAGWAELPSIPEPTAAELAALVLTGPIMPARRTATSCCLCSYRCSAPRNTAPGSSR